jgi:hypothetical protein
LYFAGRGARFRRDATKHGTCQLKQRKIDTRQRLCFDGLDMQCCSEEMSGVVKTVKGHEAAKTSPQWTADMFKAQTQPVLLYNLTNKAIFISSKSEITGKLILSHL